MKPITPTIPVGSAFLWDYRTFHNGTPNLWSYRRAVIQVTES